MKRVLTIMAISLLATGCAGGGAPTEKSTGPLAVDNALSAEEIAAGVLTPEVMWKMGRIGEFALSPAGDKTVYSRTDYNVAENRGVTTLWVQNIPDGNNSTEPMQITTRESNAGGAVWSTDGKRLYFLSDASGSSQLWSVAADGTAPTQLSDLDADIEYFGIAPANNKIWYVQRVKVEPRLSADIYPDLDKSAARVYDELMVRHWDRWTDGSHLHIFIADFDGATLAEGKDIMENEPYDAPMEPYFDGTEISWNNAGTQLAYTCKKMGETEYAVSTDSDIYLYDLASGETTNICKSNGDSTALPGYDKYPVFSPDDARIAFRSQRRPGNEADKERLFVYNIAARTHTDLTKEFDHSARNVSWDGNHAICFIAPYFGTYQVCRVDMAGDVKLVTSGDYDITGASFAAGKAVVSLTRLDHATELYTLDTALGSLTQLTNINADIFAKIQMGAIEKRMIRTSDGKEMLTWVVFPPNFDPAKKYPALLYCEGGPQSSISQMWSYRWNFQLMAANGYIVVAPNRRGTLSFGQEWTDQISGDYSGQNIRDLLAAIDEVAREPYVDRDRLGCVGASYGGYSAFYLAGVHQKRFKAFIAHCGIFNFESMYGHTEELFFVNNDYGGPYWSDNATARRSYANSPHKLVDKWDTPIMIVTGLKDFRIPYTQSLEAHTAARLHGVPSRLVAFDNEAHQVFKPQNNLVWNREFFGWLDKHVKNPNRE
jgi:dipeptidyl aminopeptidase/acylaminoacyl peptidase